MDDTDRIHDDKALEEKVEKIMIFQEILLDKENYVGVISCYLLLIYYCIDLDEAAFELSQELEVFLDMLFIDSEKGRAMSKMLTSIFFTEEEERIEDIAETLLELLDVDDVRLIITVTLFIRDELHEGDFSDKAVKRLLKVYLKKYGRDRTECKIAFTLVMSRYYCLGYDEFIDILDELHSEMFDDVIQSIPEEVFRMFNKIGEFCNLNIELRERSGIFLKKAIDIAEQYLNCEDPEIAGMLMLNKEMLGESYLFNKQNETAEKIFLEILNTQCLDNNLTLFARAQAAALIVGSKIVTRKMNDDVLVLLQRADEYFNMIDHHVDYCNKVKFTIASTYYDYYVLKEDLKNAEIKAEEGYQYIKENKTRDMYLLLMINILLRLYILSNNDYMIDYLVEEGICLIGEWGEGSPIMAEREFYFLSGRTPKSNVSEYADENEDTDGENTIEWFEMTNGYWLEMDEISMMLQNETCSLEMANQRINSVEEFVKSINIPDVSSVYASLEALKFEYFIRKKDKQIAKTHLKNALSIFNIIMSDVSLVVHYQRFILAYFSDIIQIADKPIYKSIMDNLLKIVPQQLKVALEQTDSHSMFLKSRECAEIMDVVTSIFVNKNLHEYDKSVFEMIANGKGAFTRLLRIKKQAEISHPEKLNMFKRVSELQEVITDLEMNCILRNQYKDTHEAFMEKREAELKISEMTADELVIPWVTYEEIVESLPESSLVVEYYYYFDSFESREDKMKYSQVFLKKDQKGTISFKWNKTAMSNYIVEKCIDTFWKLMNSENKYAIEESLSQMSNSILYLVLVLPLREYLTNDINRLYISSDGDIRMIPFGILGMLPGWNIINSFDVININSSAEIKKDVYIEVKSGDALVIGNPLFSYGGGELSADNGADELMHMQQLSMSKIEAQFVARKLGVKPKLKREAVKNALLHSNAGVIHISTHGYFAFLSDNEDKEYINPLSRSCMFFTGVNDWLATGEECDPKCGNGVLTAQELLYSCDLRPPQLVSLAACFSGMGFFSNDGGVTGFRSAFLALGAKAVVASLWEADDFATAVLFDYFYASLKTYSVAKALSYAQQYVRDITVRQLRSAGWFSDETLRQMGRCADDVRRRFKYLNDEDKPFSQLKYWGGFIVIE